MYRLEIVETRRAAQEAIKWLQPALVPIDHRLPDGKRNDLASIADTACPVIVMTARGSEQIVVHALKAGAQDYLINSADAFAHMPETVSHSLKQMGIASGKHAG